MISTIILVFCRNTSRPFLHLFNCEGESDISVASAVMDFKQRLVNFVHVSHVGKRKLFKVALVNN